MAITYKGGNRLVGVSSDLTSFTGNSGYTTPTTNSLNLSAATGWDNGSKIQSTNTFTVGDVPFMIEVNPRSSGSIGFFGLGQGTLTASPDTGNDMSDSMKFGMYIAGESKIYEYEGTSGGTLKNTQATFNSNDVYRIKVDLNGAVTYYRQASGTGDFNLEYSSSNLASGTYYFQANGYQQNTGFEDIKFIDNLKPTADGKHINGSTFTETDSGREFILNYGEWAETNQPSNNIAELLNDYSSVRKQHIWSFFSGSASGTINGGTTTGIIDGWSLTDNASASGSHSYGCDDSVDGGFKITTSTNEDDAITFSPSNNHAIEWVNYAGAVWIAVAKQFSTTSIKSELGLKTDTSTSTSRSANMFLWDTDAGYSTIRFVSSNYAQAGDTTDTGVSFDTNWHVFKGVQNGTNCKGSIDGILRATNTGTQPDQKQNFNFMMKNGTNSARSIAIRYCEVYNT